MFFLECLNKTRTWVCQFSPAIYITRVQAYLTPKCLYIVTCNPIVSLLLWPTSSGSVQFSRLVKSDSLQPPESQHTRPPCPSPSPGVHSNSCPSSRWWHPAISSSVSPSPAPHPSQHQGLFQRVSSLHEVASIGVSASASVLPMNTQDWSPLGWTAWISLQSRESQESSPIPQFKSINSSALRFL